MKSKSNRKSKKKGGKPINAILNPLLLENMAGSVIKAAITTPTPTFFRFYLNIHHHCLIIHQEYLKLN